MMANTLKFVQMICGEVNCHSATQYSVSCKYCVRMIELHDFAEHFRSAHLEHEVDAESGTISLAIKETKEVQEVAGNYTEQTFETGKVDYAAEWEHDYVSENEEIYLEEIMRAEGARDDIETSQLYNEESNEQKNVEVVNNIDVNDIIECLSEDELVEDSISENEQENYTQNEQEHINVDDQEVELIDLGDAYSKNKCVREKLTSKIAESLEYFINQKEALLAEETHTNESATEAENNNVDFDDKLENFFTVQKSTKEDDEDEEEYMESSDGSSVVSFPHPCLYCERGFQTKSQLYRHTSYKHPRSGQRKVWKGRVPRAFKCNKCDKAFMTQLSLDRHDMRVHTGIVCDICGKSFTIIANLEVHKRRHLGEKTYNCQDCSKNFYTKRELEIHTAHHTKNYELICDICGRHCRDSGILKQHIRRHTGERPYACGVCGKRFFEGHDRNEHEKTHSDVRDHQCNTCGKAFHHRRALKVHEKRHVKDRNHACNICGKRFINEKGVAAHMRSHENVIDDCDDDDESVIEYEFL